MATYPGMTLGGEVRESISLDEDDLSDVEDEVFIRDGKNGYKFAEDMGVKRPLMAPRRKISRPDLTSRIRNKPQCRAFCKPCCYIFGALIVLIGLIALVVILVSMFPLPLDKLKNWIIVKTAKQFARKLMPCTDLTITDVWTTTLPKLTSESFVRAIDIDRNGIDDVIIGFGTGDNYNINPDIFCPMFFQVSPPCGGGLIALNGTNGHVVWRKWMSNTVFTLVCTVDINSDGVPDCLVTTKGGVLAVVNAKNGSTIWEYDNRFNPQQTLLIDVYTASFVPDQDGDKVMDILTAHTSRTDLVKLGHLILISGLTGDEIQRISLPANWETYYPPQIFTNELDTYVLFGTGSPTTPGSLNIILMKDIVAGRMDNITTIYKDKSKGVITPSVLVDLTGDKVVDIVISMFNSTVVAIDGNTLEQLWNFTLGNSETLSMPTPGYFNDDNVTDFLVKYQTGPGFPVYYYSQTYVIDGKTGKPIYEKPIIDSVGTQMGSISLQMNKNKSDWMLFWSSDCRDFEGRQDIYEFISGSTTRQQSRSDICRLRFNSTMGTRLYALNQFNQPPGVEIYSSDERISLEYNNTIDPVDVAKQYFKNHPQEDTKKQHQQVTPDVSESYKTKTQMVSRAKSKDRNSYRHKGSTREMGEEYSVRDKTRNGGLHTKLQSHPKLDQDYLNNDEWSASGMDKDYNVYPDDTSTMNFYNENNLTDEDLESSSDQRGTKSRYQNDEFITERNKISKKKNLEQDTTNYGIYSYRNIRNSKNRLLHDVNSYPTDILRDTYLKNRERELRKSRFEQRDLLAHRDKITENDAVVKAIEEERQNSLNVSENLWDLETAKEREDRENGVYRGKRDTSHKLGVQWITSVGVLVKSDSTPSNSLDLVFLTYWLPPVAGAQLLLEKDIECISNKIKTAMNSKEKMLNYQKTTLEELFKKECIEERVQQNRTRSNSTEGSESIFPYFEQISHLNLGMMTVYKVRIECKCQTRRSVDVCERFAAIGDQRWPTFMGKNQDGYF